MYGELYNSDEFINEHKQVQNRSPPPPDDPGCKLEKVIAALMFWSDSTHLMNFGVAKLWPIYLFFGNLSKYIRSRPSSGACQHLTYIPSVRVPGVADTFFCSHAQQLPDLFESWISSWHPHWDTQLLEPNGSNTVSGYLRSGPFHTSSGHLPSSPVGSYQLLETPTGVSFIFLVSYILDLFYVLRCFPMFSDVFPFWDSHITPVSPTQTL